MKNKGQIISLIFFLILGIEIFFSLNHNRMGVMFSKPLLMPILIFLAYYWGLKNRFLFFALFFSWLGDIALMFSGQKYFLMGLSAFLLAHVFYIILWKFKKKNYLLSALIVLFSIFYIIYLSSKLSPGMFIPVAAYCLVITTMGVSACSQDLEKKGWEINVIGAILFIISDSILAWNAFVEPISIASLLVMSTYGTAQFLIINAQYKLSN